MKGLGSYWYEKKAWGKNSSWISVPHSVSFLQLKVPQIAVRKLTYCDSFESIKFFIRSLSNSLLSFLYPPYKHINYELKT